MVAHNLLYDSKMLKADGVVIPQRLAHDTMVMGHLYDPAARMDLKGLATMHVDRRAAAGQQLLGSAMAQGGWGWDTIPVDVPAYWMYSTLDTCLTALLADALWTKTGGGPYSRPYELELAVIHCLREAELQGLLVDEVYRRQAELKLQEEIELLRPHIECQNPNSDKQVIELLQSKGAHLTELTEKGNLSVDKEVLRYIAKTQGIAVATHIEKFRLLSRYLGNYIEKFAPVGVGKGMAAGGAIRASTRPCEARTGRMSVTDPPLQQLPRGRVVRDALVAREGQCLVMSDFAGMEMRALASFAHEENMLAAYARGEDLHDFVARTLYGEGFTKPQRTICKNAGFGKVYGSGIAKFAVTAQISHEEAEAFLGQYNQLFPGVDAYLASTSALVLQRAGGRQGIGYVETIDGRRLPCEGDKPYKGVNYTIQGSCAVSVKEKIVELDAAGLGEFFRLAVHDELIFEVPTGIAAEVRRVIQRVMPDRRNFPGVTLEIDSDIVQRWGEHYRDDFPAYIPTEPAAWLAQEAA